MSLLEVTSRILALEAAVDDLRRLTAAQSEMVELSFGCLGAVMAKGSFSEADHDQVIAQIDAIREKYKRGG